jgi:hypothetical protein
MDRVRLYGQEALNFLNSDGLIPQLVLTIIIILAISAIISMFEMIVSGIRNYNKLTVNVLPNTYTSEQIYLQDPSLSEFDYLYPSSNEFNGIEFSFSFQLYIDPETYKNTPASTAGIQKFYNVFYKGDTANIWPNMSPGVFLNTNDNTMRIYMNSINNIKDSYVEIPNMPVGKWFHMAIVQKGQGMDVYINGNIAVRHEFKSIPKFNLGPIVVFSRNTLEYNENQQHYGGFQVVGPMKGMISKLKYYAYAISFSQIDSLSLEGPSDKVITKAIDQTPPYFHDSWWVTRYNASSAHYGL